MRKLLSIVGLVACGLCATQHFADAGVLFYAGFENTADAVATGDGRSEAHEGAPHFAAGKRGQALLAGDGKGYVSYSVKGNLLPQQGSIEFWVCPVDWEGSDEFFHVFFEATKPGWLVLYKYYEKGKAFFLLGSQQSWNCFWWRRLEKGGIFDFKPGTWHHLVATWNSSGYRFYLDGKSYEPLAPTPLPEGFAGRFLVGDRPWGSEGKRKASSLIDELYIYDRALDEKEVAWAYENAQTRKPGEDVPKGIAPAISSLTVTSYPSKRRIQAEVIVDPRRVGERFTGKVWLESRVLGTGTRSGVIKPIGLGKGKGEITYGKLPKGEYQVQVSIQDESGKEIGSASDKLNVPGLAVWRGNKIGISDTPPPPWTPMKGSKEEVKCWGRRYEFNRTGLPEQIYSLEEPLLAGPVRFSLVTAEGEEVCWQTGRTSVLKKNQVEIQTSGSCESAVGRMQWVRTAEFDGMVRYDLILKPSRGASMQTMELRFPLRPECASLWYLVPNSLRGSVPTQQGIVYQSEWRHYWWLGNEERGLCGFCETDEAVDDAVLAKKAGFRIERRDNSVEVVWSFVLPDKPRTLDRPWKFTFGLQATPVKNSTSRWRDYRMDTPDDMFRGNYWCSGQIRSGFVISPFPSR